MEPKKTAAAADAAAPVTAEELGVSDAFRKLIVDIKGGVALAADDVKRLWNASRTTGAESLSHLHDFVAGIFSKPK